MLARANALERSRRRAWVMYFEQLGLVQELAGLVQDAQRYLDSAPSPPDLPAVVDATLKKFQQLVQELGRSCQCPVCLKNVSAAETNPEHESFMRLLYCGHLLCGDCAATMKCHERPRCPLCRIDIASQIASAVHTRDGAESRPRPKRDADDLIACRDERPPIPEGGFVSRYRGACYVCEAPWTAGATVAKHRRLENKRVCGVECAEAPMPCSVCGEDASKTAVLRNGAAELKRFFCLSCVRLMKDRGEARAIVGATRFLNKHSQ